MDLATLTGLVTAEFAGRAGGLGLTADAVRTDYVLNWGGFVNQSFRIGDGRRAYHLKLSADPEGQAALAAWYRIHDVLTANYQAPPVIDWITIGGTDHQGLLFPHVDGAAPARWDREWRHAIGTVILRLHADHTLRRRAFGDVSPPSCESGYRDDFHARFVADLAEVRAHRPAFVSDDDVRWMEAEVADLVAQVGASEAFQEPADALIHGDLWPNNILALPNGSWYLLDWDDHRLGDPALDLAKLLNPGPGPADAPDDTEINALVGFDSQVRERFELYARAARLDWIIDPLADWIEAAGAPDHTNAVRIEKERQYREARARYR